MTDSELRAALEAHHSESYGWALVCCARSSVDAETVLHTVYLKALMGKARYDGKALFKTWMFSVIRRTAADERRRQILRRLLLNRRQESPAKAANASGPVQVEILVNETGEVIVAHAIGGHPLLRDAAVQAARGWVFKPAEVSVRAIKTRGILTFNFELTDEAPAPAGLTETYVSPSGLTKTIVKPATKTESLGKQMVEGVECEGERAVTTMPVGTIGNDRTIETVNETWYSPELRIIILSKRSDPRFGESTYSVTNITRSEPYAELFLPSSDYKLIDDDAKKQITLDLKEIEEMRSKIKELQKRIEKARKQNEQ